MRDSNKHAMRLAVSRGELGHDDTASSETVKVVGVLILWSRQRQQEGWKEGGMK